MAGTKDGGRAAAVSNKTKYGSDFYAKIGAKGGKRGRTGGFFANRELARLAGAKGGAKSRRGPSQRRELAAV
jgi:general stress protein YciG